MPLIGDNSFLRRFIVISAPQRSGTTALQSALKTSPEIDTFFEVFHSEQFNVPTNFFYFLKVHSWAQQLYITPRAENMEKLFVRYLRYLSGLNEANRLIVDVKDNSLHNLDAVWQDPGTPPFLVRLLRKYNIPVLRLRRRNVFLQVISTHIASHHKRYHFSVDEDVPDVTIRVNPESIHRAIAARMQVSARVDEFVASCNPCYRILYEDIFVDNRLSPTVRPVLSEAFGTDIGELESPLRKINVDPLRRVENPEEVLSYFSKTPLRDMVSEALATSATQS